MNIKNKRKIFLFLGAISVIFVVAFFARAASTNNFNITAYILDKNSQSIADGEYEVRFALYDKDRSEVDPYPSDSDPKLWQETQKIYIFQGVLSANLGITNPFPTNLDFNNGDFYISIRIGTDSEMAPRKKLSTVPFANNAAFLNGKTVGNDTGNIPTISANGSFDSKILANIDEVGTVTAGTWEGDVIDDKYIADDLTGKTYNGINLVTTTGMHTLSVASDVTIDQDLSTLSNVRFNNLTLGGTLDVTGNVTGGTYNGNTITTGTGTLSLGSYGLTLLGNSIIDQDLSTTSTPTFDGINLTSGFSVGSGDIQISTIGGSLTVDGNVLPGGDSIYDLGEIGMEWSRLYVDSINTGQGDYELYAMDQDVLVSSSPTFAGITLTGLDGILKTSAGIVSGSATTTDLPEGTNQYYLDSRARSAISETVTGLGYDSATGIFSLTAGYVVPTTTQETNWAAAYANRVDIWNAPLSFAGNTVSLDYNATNLRLTASALNTVQDIAATSTPTFAGITLTGLDGILKTSAGIVSGSATTTDLPEGTNQYYLDSRARSSISSTATGLSYSNTTGAFSLTSGYVIPTTIEQTNWATAYTHSLITSGNPHSVTKSDVGLSNVENTALSTWSGSTSLTTLGTIATGTWNGDIIDIAYGGTGLASVPTVGQLLIGNGTDYSLATLTPSTGISITSGPGSISVSNTGVTGLTGTANQISVSASSGNITLSLPQNIATTSEASFSSITLTNPLVTSSGGTGLASYTAGDMLYYSSGTALSKLASGTEGQVLVVSSGLPSWSSTAASTPHDLLSASHGDTTAVAVQRGDLISGQGISATWSRLAIGADGFFLKSNGTDMSWAQPTKNDVGLSNVENTALSTWSGSTSLTTLGTIATGTWNATTIGIGKGGTGITGTPTNGQLLIGNGTGYTLATLTQGAGITVSNGSGTVTVTNAGVTGLSGTVDQVDVSNATGSITLSLPQSIAATSSPTFTGINTGQGAYELYAMDQNVLTTSSPTFAALSLTSALVTSSGGTGLASYTAGDMLYYSSGTALSKLAIGNPGQVLVISGGGVPSWVNSATSTAHNLLSSSHDDTTVAAVQRGDLITGQGSAPALWNRLSIGATGQVLISDGTDVYWGAVSGETGIIQANSIDFAELKNAMTLDADLTVDATISNYSINFDSNTLFIDSANNRVGIGSVTPTTALDMGTGVITTTGGTSVNWNTAYTNRVDSWTYPLSISGNVASLGYNATNLKLTANQLNTVQDLATTSAPTFTGINTGQGAYELYAMDQNVLTTSSPTFAALSLTSALVTSSGGTGLASYTAGDMLYYSSGTALSKLASGTEGQVLVVSSGLPSWSSTAASTPHDLLSASHGDTTAVAVQRGDLISGQGISATWSRLAIGADGFFLKSNGTDMSWAQPTKNDVGLSNVENTALSTWSGSTSLTTLGTIATGTWNATTIGIGKGGTGITGTPTNGQLLIGNGTGYTLANITPSTGISVANGMGSTTISNTGVTSLAGTTDQVNVSASSGSVTLSLPQSIATTSSPTFLGLTLSGPLSVGNGGTGLATIPQNSILYASAANTLSALMPGGNQLLVTNGSGIPNFTSIISDTFTQYALLAGRSGGQTLNGGTAASNNLTLDSTSNGTKGYVLLNPSGGNVGIGTTAPGEKLQIGATGVASRQGLYVPSRYNFAGAYLKSENSDGTGASLELISHSDASNSNAWKIANSKNTYGENNLVFASSTAATTYGGLSYSERFRIDSNGNVGIGITSPNAKLDVVGTDPNDNVYRVLNIRDDRAYAADVGGGISFLGKYSSAGSWSTFAHVIGAKENSTDGNYAGYLAFKTRSSSALPTERMRIDSSGNVGIGTASPTLTLSVQKDTGQTSGEHGLVYIGRTSPASNVGGLYLGYRSDGAIDTGGSIRSIGNLPLIFGTTANETAMAIANSGNIGIGTTTPATKLDVSNTVDGTSIRISSKQDNSSHIVDGAYGSFEVYSSDASSAGAGVRGAIRVVSERINGDFSAMTFSTSNVTANDNEWMRIASTGNIGIGTTAPQTSVHLERAGTADFLLKDSSQALDQKSWLIRNSSGSFKIGRVDDAFTTLSPNFVITNGGNVGIGVASPGGKLVVVGAGTTSATYGLSVTKSDGTSNLFVRDDGNVGIGTTTPLSPLDVTSGAIRIAEGNELRWSDVSGNNSGRIYASGADDSLRFELGSANSRVMTLVGGNVGIGTTDPSAAKLVIDAASNSSGIRLLGAAETTEIADIYVGAAGELLLDTKAGSDSGQFIDIRGEDNQYGLILRDSSGVSTVFTNFYMNDAATDYLNIVVGNSNATTGLVVSNDGNVGIGTTTPSSRLDITTAGLGATQATSSGLALVNTTAATAVAAQQISPAVRWRGFGWKTDAVAASQAVDFRSYVVPVQGAANPTGYLSFGSSVNDGAYSDGQMVLTTTGNVGIGTTTPGYKLDVQGGTGVAADKINSRWGYLTNGADYAEYFFTNDTDLKSGEVVCVDVTKSNAVKRCARSGDNNIMGIVSTNPSIVGNGDGIGRDKDPHYKVIGMIGQVPGLVSNENGNIQIGDSLTAASTPGKMRKADAGESTVGVALQNFSNSSGTIQILISRRNQSLTVEKVEQAVSDNITAMNIQDQVDNLVAEAKTALDTQISDQSDSLNILTKQVADITTANARLQEQMDLLQEQNQAVVDFIKILNVDSLIYKDVFGNLDLLDGKLTVKDIEAFGTIKAQDIEVTNSLTTDSLKGQNLELGAQVSGEGVINSGSLQSDDILTTEARVGIKLYITPKGSTQGKALYYDENDIVEGESFKVKIDAPTLDKDIEFNWLIVK